MNYKVQGISHINEIIASKDHTDKNTDMLCDLSLCHCDRVGNLSPVVKNNIFMQQI